MPVTPTRLKALKKGIDFDYMGDPIHVEYHPAAISAQSLTHLQDIYRRMDAARNNPDITEEEAEALMLELGVWMADALAGWDYIEDDAALGTVGEPIPITPERIVFELKRLPDFITTCVAEIGRDYNKGKVSGAPSSEPSGGISSPTASLTSSPVRPSRKKSQSSSRRAGLVEVARP